MTRTAIRHTLSGLAAVALISAFTIRPAPATRYVQIQTQLMNELQSTPSQHTQKTDDWAVPQTRGASPAPKLRNGQGKTGAVTLKSLRNKQR
jgi:hypothetical protein